MTDGLRNYSAALKELPELGAPEHITVSAAKRQNNPTEQSHHTALTKNRRTPALRYLHIPVSRTIVRFG